jgi:hypothetical protein
LEAGSSGASGMSLSTQSGSVTARFARWALGCAVRYWPEENRAWGMALAAEIDETATAFETVRWSLGGIMFFTRSVLSSVWAWMKLPAGGSLSDGPEGPSFLPKRSRVFTAVVLAAAAMLLVLPEGREAVRTVTSSWRGFQQTGSDVRKLDELAARAEKEKDAGTLAFVALTTEDPKKATAFLEQAVSLNPQYTWAYAAANRRRGDSSRKADWLAQLQADDPGNAVPYLIAADNRVEPFIHEMLMHGAAIGAEERFLANDQKWIELMEQAFTSPRYDSYFQKHSELTRTVWTREHTLTPSIAALSLFRHEMPSLLHIKLFSQIEIADATKARAAGDLHTAAKSLEEVEAFGVRMADSSGTRIEQIIALSVARSANREMVDLYSTAGRVDEAAKATALRDKIEARLEALRWDSDPDAQPRAERFNREGTILQVSAILEFVSGFGALAGILLLELPPAKRLKQQAILRKVSCWAADYAPIVFLASCGVFLLSFLPYHRALAEYRSSNYTVLDQRRLMDALWSLISFPQYALGVDSAVAFWASVTIVLTALLFIVLGRGFYRMRRATANPA